MPEETETETAAVTQRSLLPDAPPKGKFQRVDVEDFMKMKLIGPEPTPGMIASVKKMGVIQPIALCKTEAGAWKIGGGIRRIKAAILADQKTIPAMVYADDADMRNGITLIENTHRSANPLAEVRSIMALQKRNFSPEQISADTGMPLDRIQKRLQLATLQPDLYAAVLAGKIKVSVGEVACKLPEPYQKKLAKMFDTQGRLTAKDVGHIKDARKKAVTASLPVEIFGEQKPAETSDMEKLAIKFVIDRHREKNAASPLHNPEKCLICQGIVTGERTDLMAEFAEFILQSQAVKPETDGDITFNVSLTDEADKELTEAAKEVLNEVAEDAEAKTESPAAKNQGLRKRKKSKTRDVGDPALC